MLAFLSEESFQDAKRKFVKAPLIDLDQSTFGHGVLSLWTIVEIRAEVQDGNEKHRRDR